MWLIFYLMLRLAVIAVYGIVLAMVAFFVAIAFTIAGMVDIYYAILHHRRVKWAYAGAVSDGVRAIPQSRYSDRR